LKDYLALLFEQKDGEANLTIVRLARNTRCAAATDSNPVIIRCFDRSNLNRRVGPRFPHLLHDPKCVGISRDVEAENFAPITPSSDNRNLAAS
jgi:hypothetical protein